MSPEIALSVEQLAVAHAGVPAVRGLDLTVADGQCVAVVGANGAGKTSTLHGIGGLVSTSSRTRVLLGGVPIGSLSASRRARAGLGHVLEGRHVFAGLTVSDNLRLATFAARSGYGRRSLESTLEMLPELAELSERPAGTLSGGQQQLLAIGRALAADPSVIMLDEPTNGLAPILIDRVVELIRAIQRRGVAILLVEQRLEVAQAVGQTVHVLQHGRIVHSTAGSDPGLPDRVHAAYLG